MGRLVRDDRKATVTPNRARTGIENRWVISSQVLDLNPRFSSGHRSVVVICHVHVQW